MGRWTPVIVIACLLVGVSACKDDECRSNADCPDGRTCRLGLCALLVDDPDAGNGPEDPLPCRPAEVGDLILTEILASPGGVDANQDGDYDYAKDEFIEIVNTAPDAVGLTNVELRVSGDAVNLANVCLAPGTAHVHWGAEDTMGLNDDGDTVALRIDGVSVYEFKYPAHEVDGATTCSEVNLSGQSMTRLDQLDPNSCWVGHKAIAGVDWSPGTCPLGEPFPSCSSGTTVSEDVPTAADVEGDGSIVDPPDVAAACDAPAVELGQLMVNEFFYDPGSGLGAVDANRDGNPVGSQPPKEDEFVELVNISGGRVSLNGVMVSEDTGNTFIFPATVCLEANAAVVVFGKYEHDPSHDFGGAQVFSFPNGQFGLNNSSSSGASFTDGITITGPDGEQLDRVTYVGTSSHTRKSLTRAEDMDPNSAFVVHAAVLGPSGEEHWSPGRCQSHATFPDCTMPSDPDTDAGPNSDVGQDDAASADDGASGPVDAEVVPPCGDPPAPGELVINEILADPAGAATNGQPYDATECEYVEIVNITQKPLDLTNVIVTSTGSASATLFEGCLDAHHGVLLFGGGTPALETIPGTIVMAHPSLELKNSGGTVSLTLLAGSADDDVELDSYGYGNELAASPGESYVRDPDGFGVWTLHSNAELAAANLDEQGELAPHPHSPGLCADNVASFPSCLADNEGFMPPGADGGATEGDTIEGDAVKTDAAEGDAAEDDGVGPEAP